MSEQFEETPFHPFLNGMCQEMAGRLAKLGRSGLPAGVDPSVGIADPIFRYSREMWTPRTARVLQREIVIHPDARYAIKGLQLLVEAGVDIASFTHQVINWHRTM